VRKPNRFWIWIQFQDRFSLRPLRLCGEKRFVPSPRPSPGRGRGSSRDTNSLAGFLCVLCASAVNAFPVSHADQPSLSRSLAKNGPVPSRRTSSVPAGATLA